MIRPFGRPKAKVHGIRAICRARIGWRDTAGFTLVEMLVTMIITLIVVALIPPILSAVSSSTSNADSISAGTTQARLALTNMSAQVESASQICLPTKLSDGTSVTPGFSLLVLSLAYGTSQWDQWTVTKPSGYTNPVLEEQQWPAPSTTASFTALTKRSTVSTPLIADSSKPTVTTTAATLVTATTARLNGTVNPGSLATTYYFEYGTTISYGTQIPTTPASAGSGSSAVAESASPTGLTPNTTYDFRIDATNSKGTVNGSNLTFTTSTAAPSATTNAATGISATSATLNGSVTPYGLATTYYFQYGLTTSYGTQIPTTPGSAGSGTSAVAESASPTGLTPNTTYDFRIVATNSSGTTNGGNMTFTTAPAVPSATTNPATGVSTTAATLNGSVTPFGAATTYYFQYGTTTSYGSQIPATPGSAGSGQGAVAESANLTGLTPNTTYDFQIVAINTAGTGYGGNQTFTTPGPPLAITNAATGVSDTAATINGWVTPNSLATTYYFQYGTTTSYGTQVPATPASAGSGSSAVAELANLTGLTPGTTYDFQIVATNSAGTSNGVNLTFTTAGPPSAGTSAASGVTDTAATINGTVTPNGLATTYFFQYGTTTSYGTQIPATAASAGSGTSAVAELANLTGLTPNTTYDFQIVATNADSTSNGGNMSFTTGGPPSATTNAATGISSAAATLNGTVTPNGLATTYYFQYGTTTSYGTQVPATPPSAGSGSSALAESTIITGLTPKTTYDFRFIASNADGIVAGANMTFTTTGIPGAATAATQPACVSATSATLNGLVNPDNQATTYYFQYGTTTSYGTQVPVTSGSAGSGSTAVEESAPITGLTANTTYDYQLVATNSTGTSYSGNETFTTLPTTTPSSSRIVAMSIVNTTLNLPFSWPGGSTTVDAATSNGSPQSLVIDLLVGEGHNNNQKVELKSTIAALGTPYTTSATFSSED